MKLVIGLEGIDIEHNGVIDFSGYPLFPSTTHFNFLVMSTFPMQIKKLTYRYLVFTEDYLGGDEAINMRNFHIEMNISKILSPEDNLAGGLLTLSPPINSTGGLASFLSLTGFSVANMSSSSAFQLTLHDFLYDDSTFVVYVTTSLEQLFVNKIYTSILLINKQYYQQEKFAWFQTALIQG